MTNGSYTIKMAKKLPARGKQVNGVADENAGSGPERSFSVNVNEVVDLSVSDVRLDKPKGNGHNGMFLLIALV
jgi:hypothetical protein